MPKAQKILLDTCIENFIIDERIHGSSPYTVSYYERVLRYFRERSGIASLDELDITVCGNYVLSLMQSGLTKKSFFFLERQDRGKGARGKRPKAVFPPAYEVADDCGKLLSCGKAGGDKVFHDFSIAGGMTNGFMQD